MRYAANVVAGAVDILNRVVAPDGRQIRNIFVLCSGRSGSATFAVACSHIRNYSSSHERNRQHYVSERLAYPPDHIEVDNRLSWYLGRLDAVYGARAAYVHLTRDPSEVAASYAARHKGRLAPSWMRYIMGAEKETMEAEAERMMADMVEVITANIQLFLRDKLWMPFRVEHHEEDWPRFWEWVGAEGNYRASLKAWNHRHNVGKG